jgi:hypothetical protein
MYKFSASLAFTRTNKWVFGILYRLLKTNSASKLFSRIHIVIETAIFRLFLNKNRINFQYYLGKRKNYLSMDWSRCSFYLLKLIGSYFQISQDYLIPLRLFRIPSLLNNIDFFRFLKLELKNYLISGLSSRYRLGVSE